MAKSKLALSDLFSLEAPFAMELRRLLAHLRSQERFPDLKTILVTSSTLDEGKSTFCTFLAMTAARKGQKTLLIDADLRRPTLHHNFATSREGGLSEILSDGANVKSTIRKTPFDLLDLITAGKAVAEPADIFDHKAIGLLATEMKFYYDLILIDCAPVIPVSDPMLLAHEVDGTLMVVKAGSTQRDLAKRAAEILVSSGGRVLGVVVNNMAGVLPSQYDYSRYDYRYPQSEKPSGKAADTSEKGGLPASKKKSGQPR